MTPTLNETQDRAHGFQSSRPTRFGVPIPRIALPVTAFGAVVTAGAGNEVVIVQYEVKPNWFALIEGIVFGFSAGLNAGDATFTVDIDRPVVAFATVRTTGYPEKDYGAVPFPLGSFVNGPMWPCHFRHRNKETIRIKAKDNVGLGAGQFQAALVGWEWPETAHGS